MKIILARTVTIIFFVLAMIHFYWALGGQWGFESTLPSNEQGIKVLDPKTIDSIMVGSILLLFGILYLFSLTLLKNKILNLIRNNGLWTIPIIFIIRAIGDFKYVGFFKQIKGTAFANLDTTFYSPLCLIIGLMGILLIKIKNKKANDI
ncbi:DUF3995 domain-containing protein [Croceitalea rosinachiae]|uniref:DUF3995 domain-containing protein n=1 Tax=Croceitalea rosinachiae TaxID=3075596 RepID=A0ABU3A9R3_9FLAO|nr:DUF3995 domain-containing protein [Croceitalea sp. F388]MDT0606272.1 DUF3995 domain-containing protein [Croceitalea sp. F388]